MLLEYVSFPHLHSPIYVTNLKFNDCPRVLELELADLRQLCTVGKARLLQRCSVPSNYRRTPRMNLLGY